MDPQEREEYMKRLGQELVDNLNHNVLREAAEKESDPEKKKEYEQKADAIAEKYKR